MGTGYSAIAIYPDASEWVLYVGYKKDAEVSGESPKLSTWMARNDAERDRIAACRVWIQISSAPDYNMVYFNHYAWTMGFLENQIPDVKYWDNITGEWLPE
jgi:hypothetical protein